MKTLDLEVVAMSIVSAFGYVPEKKKAWDHLLQLAEDENRDVKGKRSKPILLFPSMQDREKVWADFIAFAGSGDNRCRIEQETSWRGFSTSSLTKKKPRRM